MAQDKILIVAAPYDPHADAVIIRLRQMGHDPVRLNPQDIPHAARVSAAFRHGRLEGEITTAHHCVKLAEIRSVWWRKPKNPKVPAGFRKTEGAFARKEAITFTHGLWASLDCFWVSHPDNISRANHKVNQLWRAVGLGFDTPQTLITSDPKEALSFFDALNGRMVYKSMSGTLYHPLYNADAPRDEQVALLTSVVSREQLEQWAPSISSSPCLFQEYIEKRCEYRVTIIEDEVYVAEIDSQANPTSRIDWRNNMVPLTLRRGELPPAVIDACLRLVRSYGLVFSAIDLIRTPDDRYVFLENNPNGQWMWVEDEVPEFKMIDHFISLLVRGKPGLS